MFEDKKYSETTAHAVEQTIGDDVYDKPEDSPIEKTSAVEKV